MKIYIIGHGWNLITPLPQELHHRHTHFYVNSGCLLDDIVIPRIITDFALDIHGGINYNNWIIGEGIEQTHQYEYPDLASEHIIANYEGNSNLFECHTKINSGHVINQPNLNDKYSLRHDSNIVYPVGLNEPHEATIDGRFVQLVIYPCVGTNVGNVLVHPAFNATIPEGQNTDAFIHLSDIISYFEQNSPTDEILEFYWLACRSHL